MDGLCIGVAGWRSLVCFSELIAAEFPFDHYREFECSKHSCQGKVICHLVENLFDQDPPGTLQLLIRKGEKPILYDHEVKKRFDNRGENELFFLRPTVLTLYDPPSLGMEVLGILDGKLDSNQFIQASIFNYYAYILAELNGMLIHGYGFILDGKGAAIIGPPDAGKSTAGNLIQHDAILSDDALALTNIDEQPIIHSTPFAQSGITDGPASAPLSAFFFPRKSDRFEVKLISPVEAFQRYLQEHDDYVGRLMKEHKVKYFEHAHTLFYKVPSYELSFTRGFIDTDQIYRLLQSKE